MKLLLTLLLGIVVGIGGEWLIPKHYRLIGNDQCLVSGDKEYRVQITIRKLNEEESYPWVSTDDNGIIPSYRLFWSALVGETKFENCASYVDGNRKLNK